MREGAAEGERPKLGRPAKISLGVQSEKSASISPDTSEPGEVSPATDLNKQNTQHYSESKPVETENPVSSRKSRRRRKPKTGSFNNRGQNEEKSFESAPSGSGSVEPASIQTRMTNDETAKIQTRLGHETLSGNAPHPDYVRKGPIITTEMFQKWTPDLLDLPTRPVRQSRNPPQYVD